MDILTLQAVTQTSPYKWKILRRDILGKCKVIIHFYVLRKPVEFMPFVAFLKNGLPFSPEQKIKCIFFWSFNNYLKNTCYDYVRSFNLICEKIVSDAR
jgi:hypothetical protein